MFKIRNLIYRTAINIALKKPSPQTIPLHLPDAKANDFYAINLFEYGDTRRSVYIDKRDGKNYEAVFFNTTLEPGYKTTVLGSKIHQYKFHVRYYLHGYEFRIGSPLELIFASIFPYFQLIIRRDRRAQSKFNQQPLTRRDRIELLRMFVEKTTENLNFATNTTDLLQDLHSLRSFSHPQRDTAMNYYRLIMDSFAKSGDLELVSHAYKLTDKGVATLAQYELEERRFKENIGQQRVISTLTWVLIGVGLLQAAATYFAP